jgi:peptidoglycan/LPS O-acetylase OafA/YrhL
LWYIHPQFFPEAWSLAIEEWFYISLPLLFLFFHLFLKNKTSKNILTIVLISITIFTSTRLILLNNNFDLIYWDFNVRKIVLYRLDAILYGVLAYQLFTVYTSFFTKYRYRFLVSGALGLFFSYYFFYQKTNPVFSNVFFLSSTSLSIALCVPFFYNFRFKISWLKNFITVISVSSYSMYLIHYTIIFRIFNSDLITKNLMHATIILLLYLLVVLVSSVFVYRFVEKPLASH